MMSANPDDHDNHIMSQDQEQEQQSISWKVYHNPIYISSNYSYNPLKLKHKQLQRKYSASAKYIHDLHSDLKMNVGFDHQLNLAKTQISELKLELEMERKLRKKMETLNKNLSKELVNQGEKEKKCVCEDLNKEISRLKEEMEKMKKEMEEERKMLRMAEVLREERVQMKLADAHMFYHNKFVNQSLTSDNYNNVEESKRLLGLIEHRTTGKTVNLQRKASPEAENPHIKQGIKGFVEFQRAIKAKNGSNNSSSTSCSSNGSKQSKDLGGGFSKLECQKAQLKVLFKHKYPLPYSHHDHLIPS